MEQKRAQKETPNTYGQLIFSRIAKNTQLGKGWSPANGAGKINTWRTMGLDSSLTYSQKLTQNKSQTLL